MLTHGELLQAVVRLEHDLPEARVDQPRGLEALRLHRRGVGADHRVQGEEGLAAVLAAHPQCGGQVFQIHRGGGLHGGSDADALRLVEDERAHEARLRLAAEARGGHVDGDVLRLPADAVLRAQFLLLLAVLLLARRLLLVEPAELRLGLAPRLGAGGLQGPPQLRPGLSARASPRLRGVACAPLQGLLVHAGPGCLPLLLAHGPSREARAVGQQHLLLRSERVCLLGGRPLRGGVLVRAPLDDRGDQRLALEARADPAGRGPLAPDELEAEVAALVLQGPHHGARGEELPELGRRDAAPLTHGESTLGPGAHYGPQLAVHHCACSRQKNSDGVAGLQGFRPQSP
mmetsp:Transcript_113320/g.307724  ORF Transcript_113320/g.307724 Transcript_113320/m.307724 type:complete len:345 (+) Transcript_113320:581-1615(+)